MAKFKNIFEDIFLVEKKTESTNRTLKVFYNIDVHINNPEEQPEQPVQNNQPAAQQPAATPVVAQAPQVAPAAPMESVKENRNLLTEESELDYVYKNAGVVGVSNEEADNIQTFEDLLDFLADKTDNTGRHILDEVVVEVVLAMSGTSKIPIEDIVKKEDKIIISVDYGHKIDDSIGFKLLKRIGVNDISIVMKKDNEVLDAKFDLRQFNGQIINYRNEVTNAGKNKK